MSELVGTVLGDYRLEALLGAGALGQMYRASQRLIGVPVAVKVLDRSLTSDPQFKLRFVEHAQLVAGLAHPHLIKVHHFGEQDGCAYVVMELLPGPSFEALRSAPTINAWDPALWWMVNLVREAAEGIAVIHDRRLVHGDLKRSNLLLTTMDRTSAHVKVTDVGLRRLLFPSNGAGAGGGEADTFEEDVQQDLHALGCLLYEATTGRMVSADDVVTAGVTPPGQLVAGYPAALEQVVLRCIAAMAADRFGSATDLAQVLRSLCEAEAGTLRPSGNLALRPSGATTVVAVPPRRVEIQVTRIGRPPRPPQSVRPGGVPSIHVLDGAGAPIDVKHVRGAGLTIGTAADSDIVLDSDDVSPTHARIDWDGHRVTVTDLGSATNSLLEGHRLLPQVGQEWGRDQWLQVGPYWLWLEQTAGPKPADDIIEILLDQSARVMEITPGRPTVCRLTLVNQTVRVDRVTLSVRGIPSEWVEGTDRETRLQPYERKEVTLAVNVPKTPAGRAGKYDVTISVNSTANRDVDQGSADAHWTVLEFWTADVAMAPTKAGGFRHAKYTVTLHHEGNKPTTYALTGADEDKHLACAFSVEGYTDRARLQVDLEPGARQDIKLAVAAPRRWVGSSTPHGFTVQANPTGRQERLAVEGQFTHRPIFPMWVLAAVPVLLIALLYIGAQYGKPEVRTVYMEPLLPNAGQAVTVFWDAPMATRIRISVNDSFIRPDPDTRQARYIFADGFTQSTRIKVLASNWFGEASQEVTVAPKPPPPPAAAPPAIVDLFDVRPLAIAPNQEVTLRWHTTGASRVELNPLGTVDTQGTTTHSPPGSQTYTLTAFNKDNQPTTRTLMVQVREAPAAPVQVSLSGSSPDAKPNSEGVIAINVGQVVNFQWQARNAQSVRLDAINPVMLQGASGQKQALLKGEGHYTFALVATNAKGEEIRSKSIEVTATCSKSRFLVLKFPCSKTPQVQW
jgi:tRNA A-37 threonylcarbamoyl transferase component Bud32